MLQWAIDHPELAALVFLAVMGGILCLGVKNLLDGVDKEFEEKEGRLWTTFTSSAVTPAKESSKKDNSSSSSSA